jgi:hypothetical protein
MSNQTSVIGSARTTVVSGFNVVGRLFKSTDNLLVGAEIASTASEKYGEAFLARTDRKILAADLEETLDLDMRIAKAQKARAKWEEENKS